MRLPKVTVIDFESDEIKDRPDYPPEPCGVSILEPGKKPRYYAWGHPEKNNCTKAQGVAALRKVWKGMLLFHNSKFDVSVACEKLGLPMPKWDNIHDTLYLLFLHNPHAVSLSLKPAAEELLGMPPEEQQAVRQWLIDHGICTAKDSKWGRFISKAPGDLVGRYAVGDVVRTLKLFQYLWPIIVEQGMLPAYDRERQLMPILLKNEQEGMRVDMEKLQHDLPMFEEALVKADAWIRKRLGKPDLNLDADDEMAALLHARNELSFVEKDPATGEMKDMGWPKTAKKGKPSMSKKHLLPERFRDQKLAQAWGYRNRLTTVLSMSMRPWLRDALKNKGYITTDWNQVRQAHGDDGKKGTRSGRLSCGRFMNITKDFADKDDGYVHPKWLKVPELPRVRVYILPDEGCTFLHRDLSQQEIRMMAHFEDGPLCHAYNENPKLDVHNHVQALVKQILGLDIPRRPIKTLNFSKSYGMGVPGLMLKLRCSKAEAEQFVRAHKAALPGVYQLDKDAKAKFQRGEPIRTWGGRLYRCKPPIAVNGRLKTFEYTALSYLIQPSSADWTKEAIIRYDKIKKYGRLMVSVHDEINISCPDAHVIEEMKRLKAAMEGAEAYGLPAMELDVPMLSDGKAGKAWGTLEKYKD